MDTRFWGPSAWRLFHLQTFALEKGFLKKSTALYTFYKNLPFILPCKFCRESLAEYYESQPLKEAWDSDTLTEWLYTIHNRVNDKLRKQHLLRCKNPSFSEVRTKYEKWVMQDFLHYNILGFDFFKSVAYISAKENPQLELWWSTLAESLPFPEWRSAWSKAEKEFGPAPVEKGKHSMLSWLYRIHMHINKTLNGQFKEQNFQDFSHEARAFSSKCSDKSKTCRANKFNQRNSLKKHRKFTLKQVGGFY